MSLVFLFLPDKSFVRFFFFFFFFGIVSLLCIYCNCFGKANYRGQDYEVMRERIIINEVIELNSVYSSYSFFFFLILFYFFYHFGNGVGFLFTV